MPNRNDWFPSKRVDQLAMAKAWLDVITAKKTEWHLRVADTAELADWIEDAEKWLDRSMSMETNKVINAHCKEAFKGLETLMRFIKAREFFSPPLTDPDFISLGLKPKDHIKTPINKPQMPPEAALFFPNRHLVELNNIRLSGNVPKEDKRAYYGVSIRVGILDASERNARYRIAAPPKTGDDLPNAVFTRKKKYLFDFDGESGKTIYFCLRYENPKAGEDGAGPYGQIIEAVAP